MANVELIEYTGKGRADEKWHAADLLLFTKMTRLKMDSGGLEQIKTESESWKREQLNYMAGTIPSSWEFVDLTFVVTGVTRAVAQQMTRTRTASYAMQSMRVVDVSDVEVENPFPENAELNETFDVMQRAIKNCYVKMVQKGAKLEDARGIMPLNTHCNLVVKYNLRALVDLILARKSLRAQGEYAKIADQMESAVLEVWPWADRFFAGKNEKAIGILENVAGQLPTDVGKGLRWDIAKSIDLLRK